MVMEWVSGDDEMGGCWWWNGWVVGEWVRG